MFCDYQLQDFQLLMGHLSFFLIFPSDQVIGKALVLDEIINYIQSLQNQVEVISHLKHFIDTLDLLC